MGLLFAILISRCEFPFFGAVSGVNWNGRIGDVSIASVRYQDCSVFLKAVDKGSFLPYV